MFCAFRGVAVAAPTTTDKLDEMTSRANAIQDVFVQQNVVATSDSESRSFGVMNDVACDRHPVGLVVKPRCSHEFKARTLSSCDAPGSTIKHFVVSKCDVSASTLCIGTPILCAMNAISYNVTILNGNKINCVVISFMDVGVFNIDVLRLIDFDCFVSSVATRHFRVSNDDVITQFTMKGISIANNVDANEVKVTNVVHIDVGAHDGSVWAVSGFNDHWVCGSSETVLPVVGRV